MWTKGGVVNEEGKMCGSKWQLTRVVWGAGKQTRPQVAQATGVISFP